MTSHDDRVRYFEAFHRHDFNNDGVLNSEELMAALQDLGRDEEAAGTEHLLRTYDADGSGSISFDEFLALMEKAGTETSPQASTDVWDARREDDERTRP
ncbi:EF-hand domain-containing protein [Streptodolium elevatio]|uniref:EF-hand domain-containing protein n=1 Tax=Streptodolium elevatio TaxID=3157996 RepID=A0ABV3DH57_9ACTN